MFYEQNRTKSKEDIIRQHTEPGILYLVPTPIGNLQDITLRAIETLKQVSLIAAEDTRHTGILLKSYDVSTPQISYHKFNEASRLTKLIDTLRKGEDIAVVTDAGSPGISDPAQMIVQAAISAGINICPLPGATALIPALCASGLNSDCFTFYGFLPAQKSKRESIIREICVSPHTTILYETATKLNKTLNEIQAHCGNRRICIAREISKIYEEFIRTELNAFLSEPPVLKGEIVLLIEAAKPEAAVSDEQIDQIRDLLESGCKSSEILDRICQNSRFKRNQIYELILKLKKEAKP